MISSKIIIKGEHINTYLQALKPEAGDEFGRGSFTIHKGLQGLVIKVSAQDVVSFRAIMTSLLNSIAIVDKSINAAK